MKITFILENFYPTHRAGTETYVLNLAKGLIEQNWSVSVIIATIRKESYNYEYEDIQVFALNVPEIISTAELNGLKNPSNLNSFKKTIYKLSPDIIHLHSFSRSYTHFHLKAAYEFGAKVFFTAHLGGIFCARGDLQLFGKKQCDAKIKTFRCSACFASLKHSKIKSYAGAIVASTLSKTPLIFKLPSLNIIPNKLESMSFLRKYTHKCIAIAYWIEKAYHINNVKNTQILTQAIDTHKFTKKKNPRNSNKLNLGFIGRMNPSKGAQVLLKALSAPFLNNNINLEIITIPDKSELDFYEQMKAKFINLGYSKWMENLSHKELNIVMDNWDMLILPSTSNEAAPLVILEAYAKRIPVIGSDYPAIDEMIDNNHNGLIFKNGNSADLAKILTNLVENRDLIAYFSKNINQPKDITELVNEHIDLFEYS